VNASLLVTTLLNGLVTGMIYALMGLGLSVILGLLNIPNFAHGALYALGGYFFLTVANTAAGFPGGLVAAFVGVAIVGWVFEQLAVRRLSGAEPEYLLLLTFGFSLVLTEAIILIWGPIGFTLQPPPFLAGGIYLGFTVYPKYRLAVMIATAAIIFICWLLIERTKYGAILRAGLEDRDMASALGINIGLVFAVTFGVGTALAGLGGALMVPIRGLVPSVGTDILPFAFVVVVLGGLGSVPGVLVAGILVGLVQAAMTVVWTPGADVAVFALMALGILLRPQGLLGQR
jgi:branched-chain amino acid transport system permease protein